MSREYCDYIIDALSSWHKVTSRRMFGGYGIYYGDLMFALVFDDTLYLKADSSTSEDFEASGSEPLSYEARGKIVILSYWRVPADIMDDQEALCIWAEKAYSVALTNKKTGKTQKKKNNNPNNNFPER